MGRYPRERIEARLHLFAIDGAHRVFGVSRMPLQLHSSPSRFCDGKSGFSVMYAALSFETCIVETRRIPASLQSDWNHTTVRGLNSRQSVKPNMRVEMASLESHKFASFLDVDGAPVRVSAV
jgi:hypothetical protein